LPVSYARRTDTTHTEIVDALKAMGWLMFDTHALPNWVDAVGYRPRDGVTLFEFKSGKGKLTKSQNKLIRDGWPVRVLRTAADAARA
jgi:hypothetical protein